MKDFGFDKVDGIELLSDLCEIARHNISLCGLTSSIFNVSALEFSSYSDYDILYFYDPFRGELFSKVISRIEENITKNTHKVVIVYADPWEHNTVIKHGKFKMIDQLIGDWSTRMVNIYESVF